jgi:hypothetical protein
MAELYEPLSRLRDPNALSLRGVPKIPSGALSVEDAMMLKRMHRRHLLDPTGQPEIELQVLLKKTAGLFSSPPPFAKMRKRRTSLPRQARDKHRKTLTKRGTCLFCLSALAAHDGMREPR